MKNQINIERAILSSILNAWWFQSQNEQIKNISLNVSLFENELNRAVATIINKLIARHGIVDELAIEANLVKNRAYNENEWVLLLSTTPMPLNHALIYIDMLTKIKNQKLLRI